MVMAGRMVIPTGHPMGIRTETMRAEADLLTLTQWLSPAFPVSSYAYSHGLEAAISAGSVHDGASVADWIATVIEAGSGRDRRDRAGGRFAAMLPIRARCRRWRRALAKLRRALGGGTRAQGAAFAATRRAMGG